MTSLQTLAAQLGALFLLVGGVALLLRGFAGRMRELSPRTRFMLALATTGGLIGAPFWWAGLPASFAWALPGLAFRFLAAAGLAFGAVGLMVMARPSPARVRLALGMVATYLAPVAFGVLVLHRDRLDSAAPVSWALLALVAVLLGGSLLEMVRSKDLRPEAAPPERALWILAAAVFGLWAAALLIWPAGPLVLIWPWPNDALTTRLIGAMLLTLFLMAWMARNRASLARVASVGYATYGLWVLIACAWHGAEGRPVPWAYAGVLGLAGLLGALRAVRR